MVARGSDGPGDGVSSAAMQARRTLEKGEGEHEVAAAGGVVLRRDGAGLSRVAVIHRPKYMDWSLPKGKLENGEGFEEAALREVEEETGFRARLLEELQGAAQARALPADGAARRRVPAARRG